LGHSHFGLITNNTCYNNSVDGIELYASKSNIVDDNTCILNGCGLSLGSIYIPFPTIYNSKYNIITNNTFNYNKNKGINFFRLSHYNTIKYNEFSRNPIGIYVMDAEYNLFSENTISYNTDVGIFMDIPFHFNSIYHNNIIDNKIQARDSNPISKNYWSHSELGGNYWSDYLGLDNGFQGKPIYDGIGDTDLPHLKLDYFPFKNIDGWKYPGLPVLKSPFKLNITGNYTLFWTPSVRTTGYILEEDDNFEFGSPEVIYRGPAQNYTLKNKSEGRYYYRVKAYNDQQESPHLDIVEILVDYPPSIPVGLKAENISGSSVTLRWKPCPDSDLAGYYIWMNDTGGKQNGSYFTFTQVDKNINEYTVLNLLEKTSYHFTVTAVDRLKTNSSHSKIVTITTLDVTAPYTPIGLSAAPLSDSEVHLKWLTNLHDDVEGYEIYMNKTDSGPEHEFKLIDNVDAENNFCVISGLSEQMTYYFKIRAYDGAPNYSPFSKIVKISTIDINPPKKPKDLIITGLSYDYVTLSWKPNTERDLVGYLIYRTRSLNDSFELIMSKPITESSYTDTRLNELTTYYYRVSAVDDFGLESTLSKTLIVTTLLEPWPPEINNKIYQIEIPEDTSDNTSINLYNWFMDQNGDVLTFSCIGARNIDVTINQSSGNVTLRPRADWNGEEVLLFHATDGKYEVRDTVKVIVTPVNDQPGKPEIISPVDGMKVGRDELLLFEGKCSDVDEPYGDKLLYWWHSNISGKLGYGNGLYIVLHDGGMHRITLAVKDSSGKISRTQIILYVPEEKKEKEEVVEEEPEVIQEEKKEQEESYFDLVLIVIGISFMIIAVIMVGTTILIKRTKKRESETAPSMPKPIEIRIKRTKMKKKLRETTPEDLYGSDSEADRSNKMMKISLDHPQKVEIIEESDD
jgi:parallel beta-helix repeat protein